MSLIMFALVETALAMLFAKLTFSPLKNHSRAAKSHKYLLSSRTADPVTDPLSVTLAAISLSQYIT